jgi:pimeloyl-ACP methyl ester carboxylesterase
MTTLFLTCLVLIGQGELPAGASKIAVEVGEKRLDVFTYKPADYRDGPMLVVFHGTLRDADTYRDHAKELGDRLGMLIVAPKFDSKQFGSGMYQQGGLFQGGKLAPRERWTWSLVPKVVDEVRRLEHRPNLPYYLIGHSAGGQFLVRLTAFAPTEARRVVACNPGSDLFPTRDMDYPYGFGRLPDELSNDEELKRYLAQPLTLYLGTGDTMRDRDLDKSPEADRQGLSRFERGHNAFRTAQELAKSKGWPFAWRLIEAPGVVHDHTAMFNAPPCRAALLGPE